MSPVSTRRILTPGVDVSGWQNTVRWRAVAAAGYQFAIVKATESNWYVNPYFDGQWAGAKEAGMVRGAYHFARPDENPPTAEANFFLQRVGELEEGDLLALDLESGSGDLAHWTLEWLNSVTEHVGFRPLLYSGPYFLAEHGCVDYPPLCEFGLWLANYRATWPPTPKCWPFIAMWQYTNRLVVDGIKGPCDGNYFNGTRDQLLRYGKPARSGWSPARPAEIPAYTYVSRVGETAATIATACRTTVEELMGANPQISNADDIGTGTLVNLPTTALRPLTSTPLGETFPVRSTTNLADVSGQLNVSMLALQVANPHLNPDQIPVGATVNIPPSIS